MQTNPEHTLKKLLPDHRPELAELTVDVMWQIADAGDQELRRLARSSRRGSMELNGKNNDGLSQPSCTTPAVE